MLAPLAPHSETAQRLLGDVRASSSLPAHHALLALYNLCSFIGPHHHHHDADEPVSDEVRRATKARVQALVGCGALVVLLQIVEEREEAECVMMALRTLGALCRRCDTRAGTSANDTILVLSQLPQFDRALTLATHHPNQAVVAQGWFLLQQMASESHECHPLLLTHAAWALGVMGDVDVGERTRGRAVRFVSHLASNTKMTQSLLELGAVEPLTGVMERGNPALGSTSAVVALSVLCNGDLVVTSEAMRAQLVAAYESGLRGQPYPPDSRVFPHPRRYSLALSFLARNQHNQGWIRDSNVPALLSFALRECQSRDVLVLTLRVVWALSEPGAHSSQ